jgi:hypothetical protein
MTEKVAKDVTDTVPAARARNDHGIALHGRGVDVAELIEKNAPTNGAI